MDQNTLLIVSGIVVIVCGVSFILNVAYGRASAASRTWANAYVCGILATFALLVWGIFPSAWWTVAIGDAALVAVMGWMWSGCRQFNGRRSLYPVPMAAAVVTALTSVAAGPGPWSGATAMFLGIAVFAALAAVETLRPRMREYIHARVLTVVFALVFVFYAVRTVVFLVLGAESPVFEAYFGTPATTLLNVVLVTASAISLSILQTGREGPGADLVSSARELPRGVLAGDAFSSTLQTWLDRADQAWEALVVVVLQVDNLQQIAETFGRERRSEVVATVGRICVDSVPTASLVGQLGDGRFAVVTPAPLIGEPRLVAERIENALVDTPIDSLGGLRAMARFGVASTDDLGYESTALLAAASSAIEAAHTEGTSIGTAAPSGTAA